MSSKDIKALIRSIYEASNQRDEDAIYENWVPGAVIHTSIGDINADQGRQGDERLLDAFPDYSVNVENMVVEGDFVAYRVNVTGTHTGEWQGIAPTGKKINISNAYFAKVLDGKIAEAWAVLELPLLEQQLNGN